MDGGKKVVKKRLPLVEVEWIDSGTTKGWRALDYYKDEKPLECRTAGYLVRRDKRVIVIVQSQNFNDDGTLNQLGESMTIPRICVTHLRFLR